MTKMLHNSSSVGSVCWCCHSEQSWRENDWCRRERDWIWPRMGLQVSVHPKTIQFTLRFESVLRHEGGIIAAKYDQPGYVHAMRLVAKDDIWAQHCIIRLLSLITFFWSIADAASAVWLILSWANHWWLKYKLKNVDCDCCKARHRSLGPGRRQEFGGEWQLLATSGNPGEWQPSESWVRLCKVPVQKSSAQPLSLGSLRQNWEKIRHPRVKVHYSVDIVYWWWVGGDVVDEGWNNTAKEWEDWNSGGSPHLLQRLQLYQIYYTLHILHLHVIILYYTLLTWIQLQNVGRWYHLKIGHHSDSNDSHQAVLDPRWRDRDTNSTILMQLIPFASWIFCLWSSMSFRTWGDIWGEGIYA